MRSNKLYTIAGTSDLNGVETFRFATGTIKNRAWVLTHNGHTNVALYELPGAGMSKEDAIVWLQSNGLCSPAAVLPNAAKAPKAPEVIVPAKSAEEIEAEAARAKKALVKEAFLAKMAAGREAARAKKAAAASEG